MHNLCSKISLPLMIKAGRISERKKESKQQTIRESENLKRLPHLGRGGGRNYTKGTTIS